MNRINKSGLSIAVAMLLFNSLLSAVGGVVVKGTEVYLVLVTCFVVLVSVVMINAD